MADVELVIPTTISQLLEDGDWAEAFGDESSGNTDKTVEAFGGVPDTPFGRSDVKEIIAAAKWYGDYAETDCVGLFLLKDGRYAAVEASCDTTGWDCQAGNTMTVAEGWAEAALMGLAHVDTLFSQLKSQFMPKECPIRSIDESFDRQVCADWWMEAGFTFESELLRRIDKLLGGA